MRRPIQAVVFAFDLTLVDASAANILCAQFVFKEMKLPTPSPDAITRSNGMSWSDAFTFLTGIEDKGAKTNFCRLFKDHIYRFRGVCTFVEPPVGGLLIRLQAMNVKVGVVANESLQHIKRILEKHQILQSVNIVAVVSSKGSMLDGIKRAIRELGISNGGVLFVSGDPCDAEVARKAKIMFCGVISEKADRDTWLAMGQMVVRESVADVAEIVAANNCYLGKES